MTMYPIVSDMIKMNRMIGHCPYCSSGNVSQFHAEVCLQIKLQKEIEELRKAGELPLV